ncbi:hypothetical protein CO168_01525 [Candidatus Shapirobacteria bacterium CG_4_9_14_3_um_filter_36_12]|uniref:Uncharacterized protein n=1 Tax=Candidatus Shapirobacteria bacterium CG_4_9_14_3_um_filter_36_12 TaxID=1974877 RepID=A0A2M7XNG1_9BACT|nr:MAG: hypothetical protein CO168_01525 [Candidatus Shapirobacteria bacterium CG_4_9_14_3_um_filter_36_12]
MNRNILPFCLLVSLILTFCSPHYSLGITYFSDNFASDDSKWSFSPGSVSDPNSWSVGGGVLTGSVGYGENSYFYPIVSPSLLSDFVLESDLMNTSGVDANIFFRQSLDNRFHYIVGFRFNDPNWSQDNNNIVLYKYENGYSLIDSYPSVSIPRSINITQNIWHKIRLEVFGRSIKVYLDNVLVINKYDSGTLLQAGKIALQNWGGNFSGSVINKFDNFKISDSLTTQNKIIFLPGMGGSWNERAMVLNEAVAQSDWRMTPFVKNYDLLFEGFEDNGLVKDTDYFVYNYDWRKPLADQVTDFNNYVVGLGVTGNEKVDVVGHSLGGIVGRIWTQENPDKVGKVITLASPNAGAVKVYEMWNGAKISDSVDPGSIALNVLLALQKKNNQTSVETIRAYVPALKDLLPTFNYLKKGGTVVVPPFNNYLNDKNTSISSIFSQLQTITGIGFKTKEWINLTNRTVFDNVLGRWEQGRPASYVKTDGDATVLKKSASFVGDGNINVVANHGNVPDKSVNLVLTELGLGKTIATVVNSNFNGAVFYMGSPALMKVNCGSGDITETDGFVWMANKNIVDCMVKLTGTANGVYHLVMGNSADDESWKYTEGNISVGDTKNISVNVVDFWYEQMLRETNSLLVTYPTNTNLNNMKMAINTKNRINLINSYILFRKQKLETIITWRMVNYLERIINIEIPSPTSIVFSKQKKLALSYKSLADKTALLQQRRKKYPNIWQSLNYDQGRELLTNPNYGKYVLAEKIFGIVWY